jgi:uncharacterized repeat protein (TIGR03803 family)
MSSSCWVYISRLCLRAAATGFMLAALELASIATLPVQAQTFTVLHSFTGSDGSTPYAGLLRDAEGNFYGTTSAAGAHGDGTVFKLDKQRKLTVLHSFTGDDGAFPTASLIRDSKGNLYGTASIGGIADYGVVFKLNPAGKQTTLYRFTGGADGANPYAGLLRDAKGNLYGVTTRGGLNTYPEGVVFELDPAGKETVLHTFVWPYDGAHPGGTLIMDAKGNLYGTTEIGGGQGEGNCPEAYCGTVFKLDSTDKETLLYSFAGGSNPAYPIAGVIMDGKGNLFGTTEAGGDTSCDYGGGCGAVFELDAKTAKLTILYIFKGSTDGGYPHGGLIRDAAGNLYGTAYAFGHSGCGLGCGVVFKVDTTGKQTVLHEFTGGKDGAQPYGGLVFDEKGNLYGTASGGGAHNAGTIFEITP